MNEDEYGELLRYVRVSVVESGRSDLDERTFDSRLRNVSTPADAVVQYLGALRDELSLGSERSVRETMRRFRTIRTESGEPISGIQVDVTAKDEAAIGVGQFRLDGNATLDRAVLELDYLISLIDSERRTG